MEYLNVWLVAIVAGIACLGFFFLLTRRVGNPLLRSLLRCLAMVWLLLPAPVPDYPGQFAPAFVVWMFEGVLQSNGDSDLAVRILLGGSVAVVVLVVTWYLLFGRKEQAAANAASVEQPANTGDSADTLAAKRIRAAINKKKQPTG